MEKKLKVKKFGYVVLVPLSFRYVRRHKHCDSKQTCYVYCAAEPRPETGMHHESLYCKPWKSLVVVCGEIDLDDARQRPFVYEQVWIRMQPEVLWHFCERHVDLLTYVHRLGLNQDITENPTIKLIRPTLVF